MSNQYLSDAMIETLKGRLNIKEDDDAVFDEIIAESIGEFETHVSKRFVVPLLRDDGVEYSAAPLHSRVQVQRIIKSIIKKNSALEFNVNSDESSNSNYLEQQYKAINGGYKYLLDKEYDFNFKLQNFASDYNPTQVMGLARNTFDA